MKTGALPFFIKKGGSKVEDIILELLRQEGDFLSGEEIGKRLHVSRSAVWKGIRKLREEGYEIQAVTNKGYCLVEQEARYNGKDLTAALKTEKMGRPLYFYEETDSTNACIRRLAQEGAPEGTLAVADVQTAGRGRRGRAWTSPKGSGIWMSLLLRPNIPPAKASLITLLSGLSVCKAIERVTGLRPQIKWPNDILLNGKKIVGILTEMECEMSDIYFVVPGIGINVNTESFPEELQQKATSLRLELGHEVSRNDLLCACMEEIESHYAKFEAAGSFLPLLEDYRKRCITLGATVRVLDREPFTADVLDLTDDGELLVRRADNGKEQVVFSGEVSIRGLQV